MDVTFKLSAIHTIAEQLLNEVGEHKVIALHGQMGAGKTTLVSTICNILKVNSKVSSPTFSIINEYSTDDNKVVYHIDLYRLKSVAEAVNVGVEVCFYSDSLCLVEWPEVAPQLLPENTVHVYLSLAGSDERRLVIKS